MRVLETNRLVLRHLSVEDAPFILELVNEPSWLRFIGDRGVRNLEDACSYILKGPADMYARLGFGLYLTERKEDHVPLGICGLIKRDTLENVDIGFAFLPRYWGNGYAVESAAAVMEHGRNAFSLKRLVAITSPDNHDSIKVLERIGFTFERMIASHADETELKLFAHEFGP
jgi:RimJ/RimL family protein N-acetyltransferase